MKSNSCAKQAVLIKLAVVCSLAAVTHCGNSELNSAGLAALGKLEGTPELSEITPAQGPSIGGTRVVLSGQNFMAGATVSFNGVPATEVLVRSGTQITATLPRQLGAVGKVPVMVRNPNGHTLERGDLFAYHLGQLLFPEPILLSMEYDPQPLRTVVGDWNGDGMLDVVGVTGGRILPILSNGLGGFDSGTFYKTNRNAAAVTAADWNGDHFLDLAVTITGGVSVYLGNGSGGFAQPRTILTGDDPTALAVGDWNHDRHPDLATISRVSGMLRIFLGDGRGELASADVLSIGANADSLAIAVGDLNGDATSDVVITRYTASPISSTLTVFLGSGMATFPNATSFTIDESPVAVVLEDWNRDGKLDLAVAHGGTNPHLSIQLGDGTAGFRPHASLTLAASPGSIAVADFNADGTSDLAVACGKTLSIWSGKGEGDFASAGERTLNQTSFDVLVGDFSGDGRPDLAISGDRGIRLLLNNGSGEFGLAPAFTRVWASLSKTLTAPFALGDFNADQKLDVLHPIKQVLLGDGRGGFSAPMAGPDGPYSPVAVADFNRDGKLDAVQIMADRPFVRLGNGNGGLDPAQPVGQPIVDKIVGIEARDLNDDQKPDLVVVSRKAVFALLGDGNGGFTLYYSSPTLDWALSMAIGDINGDRRPDLLIAGLSCCDVRSLAFVFLGDGMGGFTQLAPLFTDSRQQHFWVSLLLADINGDQRDDAIVMMIDGEVLNKKVFLGNELGLVSGPHLNSAVLVVEVSGATGDFNRDGYLDLATASDIGVLTVYWGSGAGSFAHASAFAIGGWWLRSGDFNGDGNPDLVTDNDSSVNVTLNLAR